MKSDSEDLRAFAARYTAAWCSQSAANVAAFFSFHGSLTINNGTPSIGRAAILEVVQSFMTAFPDLRVGMDDLIVKGDSAAEYHWTLTGTNNGPGGTGRHVAISGFELWEFASDGLIAKSLGHFDAQEYQRQLQR